ncbi:MAG: dihydrolipoyl dehydrogenase family protein, partial [bacterium]
MENKSFDIVVIGAGPGGYTAAIRAAKLGKKVACIERDRLGGICLNWGCIPTKALIKSSEVYEEMKKADEYGFNVDNISINFNKIIERSRKVAEKQEKGIGFLFKKNKIESINGYAKFKDKNTLEVEDENGNNFEVKAENIIIATGGRPKTLPNITIDRERIISSKEAMTLKELPKELVIIGAGAIGVEFAYIYSTLGTKVTIIEALPHLMPNEDEDISKTLEREFRKAKIKYHTNSFLQNIEKNNDEVLVSFKNKKGEIEKISADYALMAIGVTGNIEEIGLDEVGVKTEKGFISVDKNNYKTNIDNIYAIGDVINTPLLAHVASH